MTIPLDNLYDYIFSLTGHNNKNLRMFRFDPHGSKGIENLICHNNAEDVFITLSDNEKRVSWHYKQLFCHDQEPLDFDFYNSPETINTRKKIFLCEGKGEKNKANTSIGKNMYRKKNISGHPIVLPSIHDKKLLLHSEKNSDDLTKYEESSFIGVYYWAHAFIALDWYRFAKHDNALKQLPKNYYINDFNVYCRAWTGSREYRLKFLELMKYNKIDKVSSISFNEYCDENHYSTYEIEEKKWQFNKSSINSLNNINFKDIDSSASATYDTNDYKNSAIDVVLETVFDKKKIHLTEKILRPIACGKPFILVSERGSLEYLRSYGFKTFENLIDESYDHIDDPEKRLSSIVKTMKSISSFNQKEKNKLLLEMHHIAEYNRKWFFSDDFFNIINNELMKNLSEKLRLLDDPTYQTAKEPRLIYRAYRRYEKYFSDLEKDIAQNVINYNEYPERIEINKKLINKL